MSHHVITIGAFDNLRSRHVRFLDAASRLGPLTALAWSDDEIRRQTGAPPKFPEAERLYLLNAIRYVSAVQIADGETVKEWLAKEKPALCVLDKSSAESQIQALCAAQQIPVRVLEERDLPVIRARPAPEEPVAQSATKKVIVTGCYDWFHSGHVRFFEEVSALGDLHVVVGHDANIRLLKGEGHPMFSQDERRYLVSAVRFVKQAWISSGHGWLDAEPEIGRIRPDIYVVNEDGDKPEKREFCNAHWIEYVVLKRTPAPGLHPRSSTELRSEASKSPDR